MKFDVKDWDLISIGEHPLHHEYLECRLSEDLILWFSQRGYTINPTFDIDGSLTATYEDALASCTQLSIPEHLAVEFKLRWYKDKTNA